MKYYYLRRTDGSIVDIPESDVQETMKRNPDWQNLGEIKLNDVLEHAPIIVSFKCPICDFVAKSEFGLKAHKRKHNAN